MRVFYHLGRLFQLAALVILPSAIWVGQLGHNEQASILIFSGSVTVFLIGCWFTRAS